MTAPKRIQRKRTKGWRMPENAVYVGRPTRWGNPFKIGMFGLNGEAFPVGSHYAISVTDANIQEAFETYVKNKLSLNPHWLEPLRGKDLACFCPEDAPWCHADTLLRLANVEAKQ